MEAQEYQQEIDQTVEQVFETMRERVSDEEMARIHHAYAYAAEAHKDQKRKSGHPYIIHPISVALIAAKELRLDTNSVCAAFLHDVVEDTPATREDI